MTAWEEIIEVLKALRDGKPAELGHGAAWVSGLATCNLPGNPRHLTPDGAAVLAAWEAHQQAAETEEGEGESVNKPQGHGPHNWTNGELLSWVLQWMERGNGQAVLQLFLDDGKATCGLCRIPNEATTQHEADAVDYMTALRRCVTAAWEADQQAAEAGPEPVTCFCGAWVWDSNHCSWTRKGSCARYTHIACQTCGTYCRRDGTTQPPFRSTLHKLLDDGADELEWRRAVADALADLAERLP